MGLSAGYNFTRENIVEGNVKTVVQSAWKGILA